jgi:YidC/Oxa1 family membrane protein insertase
MHDVSNTAASPVDAFAFFQLVRDEKPPEGTAQMVPTYTGVAVYTEK